MSINLVKQWHADRTSCMTSGELVVMKNDVTCWNGRECFPNSPRMFPYRSCAENTEFWYKQKVSRNPVVMTSLKLHISFTKHNTQQGFSLLLFQQVTHGLMYALLLQSRGLKLTACETFSYGMQKSKALKLVKNHGSQKWKIPSNKQTKKR